MPPATPDIQTRELLHRGYLFDVQRCTVRLPDGKLVQRDLIEHNGAALVLPVTDDGRVVLIRQYRFATGEELWELPCGTLEDDEDPAVCAARELTEETGYTAGRLEPLGTWWSCPGYCTERIFAFLARGLTAGKQNLDEHEQIDVEVLPENRVRRMLLDHRIADAKTLTALSLYFMCTSA